MTTFQRVSPTAIIVRVGKTLDFRNADEFKAKCEEHARQGVRYFVLDFAKTLVLDSTGLSAIYSLLRRLSPRDVEIVFAAMSRPVQVVVQLTRSYKVFRRFTSVEAALKMAPAESEGPAAADVIADNERLREAIRDVLEAAYQFPVRTAGDTTFRRIEVSTERVARWHAALSPMAQDEPAPEATNTDA